MTLLEKALKKLLINSGFLYIRTRGILNTACASQYAYLKKEFGMLDLEPSRLLALCMIAHEIYEKNIPGNVAELGVFQGDFAKYMNVLFKDRVLYLFDTFEGFDARDIKTEVGKDLSDGQEDFSRTSVELVMKKMRHPHNCIVKRGFFPETAQGVDDTFSFVSVDADLYQPIYEGLRYFYPRLSTRGFMLIHDFNNRLYPGARKAVDDFCREEGVGVFPLFDSGGSAVLVKHSHLTRPEGVLS